jgi:hypothetical protein
MKASRGRPSARRRISKEEMASRETAIIADIKAGDLSYREIAHKHGVSLPTVNNKARKAGISRGRRKGARIFVRRAPRKSATRKVARRAVAPVAAAVEAPVVARGRKRVARRVGRPRSKPGRKAARPVAAARRGRPAGSVARASGFAQEFRELVLRHNPSISLLKFDKLAKMVEEQVR